MGKHGYFIFLLFCPKISRMTFFRRREYLHFLHALLENHTSMTKHFRHKWFRIRHKICFMTNLWRIWVRHRRSVTFDTRWQIIIFRHKCLILPWRFVVSHITWLFFLTRANHHCFRHETNLPRAVVHAGIWHGKRWRGSHVASSTLANDMASST